MKKLIPILFSFFLIAVFFNCDKMPPRPQIDNPLDPANPATGGDPFDLELMLIGGGIKLQWNAVDLPDLSGYRIYRSENPDSIYYNLLDETADTLYIDQTAQNGHQYFYLVTAYNYLGESRSSTLTPIQISSLPYFALAGDAEFTATHIVTADILASGADSMRISYDSVWDSEPWEPYALARICTLYTTPAAQFVYFQAHYPLTNTIYAVIDSISPLPLTPQMVVGDSSGFSDTSWVAISFSDTGALSARLWEQSDTSDAQVYSPLTDTIYFELSEDDGEKILNARLWNDYFSTLLSDTVILDTRADILQTTHDGVGRILAYGDILHIEMLVDYGDENGYAYVDIFDNLGNSRPGILLENMGGGFYMLDYFISNGDDIVDGTLVSYFTDLAGNQALPDTTEGTIDIAFHIENMVFVPGGFFNMGSSRALPMADEIPLHPVNISDFWISQNEVTNTEYTEFLNDGNPLYWDNRMEIQFFPINVYFEAVDSLADRPVRYVSYDCAVAYAEWKGMRLPTEAEWEKAARGTDGRQYPWGTFLPVNSICNFYSSQDPFENSAYKTTPVGFYDGSVYGSFMTFDNASPYGARDMLGNVLEWCSDYYSATYYSVSPVNNPQNTAPGDYRSVRSTSWYTTWIDTYTMNRDYYPPSTKNNLIGLRLAMDP